jgi:hypothetical protein
MVFEGLWEGFPHASPVGRGIEACPGFHWLCKEFPQNDIPDNGTDPCAEFQGPGICAPSAGIVPCVGVDCPKIGVPPDRESSRCENVITNRPIPNEWRRILPAEFAQVVLDSQLQSELVCVGILVEC